MSSRPRLVLAVSLSVAAWSVVTNCTSNNAAPNPYGGSPCGVGTTGDFCNPDASLPDTGCIALNGSGGCSDSGPGNVLDAADATTAPDDANAPDTSAPDTSAPSPNVTMTVTSPTGPEPGVTVVFGDATGAVLSSQTTNDAGVASGAIPANGAVTVLFGVAGTPVNVSILGAQPGDALTMSDPTKTATSPGSPWMAVTSVPASEPSGTTFSWFGNCGTGDNVGLPGDVQLSANCFNASADTTPVLLLAEGDNDLGETVELAYAFQKSIPITTFSTTVVNDVPMSADTWMTPSTETLALTNPPVGATTAETYYEEFAGGVMHSEWLANGEAASAVNVTFQADGGFPDGGFPAPFASHPGYPDFVQSEIDIYWSSSFTRQVAAVRAAAPSTTNVFDLSQLIPVLNAPTVSTSVPGQPSVSWSAAGPVPSSAVGVVLSFTWTNASASGTWTLVSPASATSAQAPLLPAGLSAWAPVTADGGVAVVSPFPTAVVAGGIAVPSYAQFRATYPTPGNLNAGSPRVLPLASDGTFYVSAYQ
ncbi:MAG: hypothetical protein ACLQVI_27105 [Polyangiaceae bacterium]